MQRRIVCENLRSAYNVGNIMRTADALGRGVILAGYTARADHKGVRKTALGAEQSIALQEFDDLTTCYATLQASGTLIALEITSSSREISDTLTLVREDENITNIYLVVGNEVTGVELSTLEQADYISSIPMQGIKKSLNVGQAAAIAMREYNKL